MGRKRDIFIREFFDVNREKYVSECKICKRNFVGIYISNLKRHLEQHHKDIFEKEIQKQCRHEMPEKKIKFSVTMAPGDVINACVDLVTKEKVPFSFLDSESFKVLTEQIFKGLNMNPVTSRNVMSLVSEKYAFIKEKIKNELKHKMLCLKMDTASRQNRGILGINVQYFDGEKIAIRTLGLIELTKRHTATNITNEINDILDDFGFEKIQIYSVTTDNGRNMVKAVELLSINSETDTEDEELEEEENLIENVEIKSIQSVKCAAHTVQLAVKDFLKEIGCLKFFEKVRKLVKTLRTPTYRIIISAQGLPKPELDVPTRWNSTYVMLKKILEFKEFCANHLETTLNLTSSEWEKTKMIVDVLQPVYFATIKLQTEQLYLGDFYKLWLELTLEIKAQKSAISKILADCLQHRQENLLENEAVISAFYLDPRVRRVLNRNPINLMRARCHLKQLMQKIFALNKKNTNNTPSTTTMESLSTNNSAELTSPSGTVLELPSTSSAETLSLSSTNNTSSLLNDFLNSIEVASGDEESDDETDSAMREAITEIDNYNPKAIDANTDIMDYWEQKKFSHPYLYQLAQVLHCVPATQVSVERSFSALKLILTDLRANLSPTSLMHLLFVKLNKE